MSDTKTDIEFVKSILPEHYIVEESKRKGSIHCVSPIGIREQPRTIRKRIQSKPLLKFEYRNVVVDDAEDNEHWGYIFEAIKQHFGERFQEVFHNVCFLHTDFTIYLKNNALGDETA